MAYQHKPNSGSAFLNDRKTEAKHPDFKGTFVDANGNELSLAIWKKQGAKGEFLSISVTEKRQQQ